jgi:hypothetical protein
MRGSGRGSGVNAGWRRAGALEVRYKQFIDEKRNHSAPTEYSHASINISKATTI